MIPEIVNQKRMVKAGNSFLMMHSYLKYFNLKQTNKKSHTHTHTILKYSAIAMKRQPVLFLFFFIFLRKKKNNRKKGKWYNFVVFGPRIFLWTLI